MNVVGAMLMALHKYNYYY